MKFRVGQRVRFDWSAYEAYVRGEGEVVLIHAPGTLLGDFYPYRVVFESSTVESTDPVDTIPGIHGDFAEHELEAL